MRHALYRQQIERDKYTIRECCPLCHGDSTDCPCFLEFKKRNAFLKSNIPVKYQELSLDMLTEPGLKLAKRGVQDYIDNLEENIANGRGLYISHKLPIKNNHVPIGKSTLCYMVLMEAVNRGIFVYATNIRDIAFARNSDKEPTEDSEFSRRNIELSDLLLIDDIGDLNSMTDLHPYLKRLVLEVYSDRSNMKKSTLFASSLSPDQLDTVFGGHFKEAIKRNTTFLEVS